MLIQLSIYNIALIDQLRLEFKPGLNVFTGETGAGKSILIDSLRICLGERMETTMVRDKDKPFLVEAVFALTSRALRTHPLIAEYMKQDDEYLIIRREGNAESKSKATINTALVNISTLKQIARILVDFHGQYDHQLLLDSSTHQTFLDRGADLEKEKKVYEEIYTQFHTLCTKKEELAGLGKDSSRQADVLAYQINEIESANLKKGEDESLQEEYTRLSSAKRLMELTQGLLAGIEEGDGSVSERVRQLFGFMGELNHIDKTTGPLYEALGRIQIECEALAGQLSSYRDAISFDPEHTQALEARIELIDALKRKYGTSIDEIQKFLEKARVQYQEYTQTDQLLDELDVKIKTLEPAIKKAANAISAKRSIASAYLKKAIEKELKELGMPGVVFECRSTPCGFGQGGQEMIEFFMSPNLGEEPKPLAKIISGGEAARLMLALKKALVKVDPIPVLIFDEIDANIGGRLGSIVGEKLKSIALHHQILLITHLPQIASFAEHHIKIFKEIQDKRVVTRARALRMQERIEELAAMMSGQDQTKISYAHAKEMIEKARQT